MSLRNFMRGAAALALSFFACAVLAHKPSDSYLTLRVEADAVSGQWDIALRDLDLAIGLDADGDGAITWGEVRARHDAIEAYALGRLDLSSDSQPCPVHVVERLVDAHSDGGYAVLRIAGRCARPVETLAVGYRLLFDRDAQHRGLLNLVAGAGSRSAVFGTDSRAQSFRLAQPSWPRQLGSYIADGIRHIAIGFDHILFLIALLLPAVLVRENRRWRPTGSLRATLWNVFGIVSAFTVAHSLTLTLASLEFVRLPSRLVESLIAVSVFATALDNLVPFLPRRRWLVAFVFGLMHGFGFASVLLDLQLPPGSLALSLLGFNVGVEIGQLALVALVVPLAHLARRRLAYERVALGLGSAAIAVVAFGWFVERAFSVAFMPV
ncbi:MAG: HupE/UreJ family protein [Usitatibacter sp.]